MGQPTVRACEIEGCERKPHSRGVCERHYRRLMKYGDARISPRPRRTATECSVVGCGQARRKREWCELHYSRWQRRGSVADDAQAWVWENRESCAYCGASKSANRGRSKYCSQSCAVMFSRNRGERPRAVECGVCGASISLDVRHPSGRLKYTSARTCRKCRAPHLTQHIPTLAARDGHACGICGEDVDLRLQYPDSDSASVDHIIPRSLGGPDELANYRLSHLRCNIRRGNRMDRYLVAAGG